MTLLLAGIAGAAVGWAGAAAATIFTSGLMGVPISKAGAAFPDDGSAPPTSSSPASMSRARPAPARPSKSAIA